MAKKRTHSRPEQHSIGGPDRNRRRRQDRNLHPYILDGLLCLVIAGLAVFVYRGYIIEGKTDIRPDFIG